MPWALCDECVDEKMATLVGKLYRLLSDIINCIHLILPPSVLLLLYYE